MSKCPFECMDISNEVTSCLNKGFQKNKDAPEKKGRYPFIKTYKNTFCKPVLMTAILEMVFSF